MKVLGIRYCSVSKEAEQLASFLGSGLGLPRMENAELLQGEEEEFRGAIFPAGDSWIEVWPEGPGMPAGTMLQIVVDDADAWAERARANGMEPRGPMDSHGERIYFVNAPSGLAMTFQSRLESD